MDAYTILGISKNASNNEIRKAYIELAKKYHPDKFVNENDKKVAEDRFKEINEAYYELKELKRDVEATHEDNIRKAEKPKPKPEPTTYKSATGWFEHIKKQLVYRKKTKGINKG